jgi:glucose/arabinose dehydrogenase
MTRRGRGPVLVALLLCACGSSGGSGTPGVAAPSSIAYATDPAWYRAGVAIAPNAPAVGGGAPTSWSVDPALPDGLALDAASGIVSGTPTAGADAADHVVTAANAGGSASTTLRIAVGEPLPPVFATLAEGFNAFVVAEGLATPVRMARAPDGRIFFNELLTGDTRILNADGTLQPTPFAHTDVLVGNHQGLLGVALHPQFAVNGWVYVVACVPGDGVVTQDRMVVKRYTDVLGVGTLETVILDDLPTSSINNGGDVLFDLDGNLFLSVGDVEDPDLAQTDGSRAGRVLRMTDGGGVPSGNPRAAPDELEWDRGLRNTFALALHPVTGELFGADNGPDANDWLHYHRGGKNFQWPTLAPGWPVGDVGIRITGWATVIVPTALDWHHGSGWGAAYADDLFLASYDDQAIRRLEMSGPERLNLDAETVFATTHDPGTVANKPLDCFVAPSGDLYLSTFSGIYRIAID